MERDRQSVSKQPSRRQIRKPLGAGNQDDRFRLVQRDGDGVFGAKRTLELDRMWQ